MGLVVLQDGTQSRAPNDRATVVATGHDVAAQRKACAPQIIAPCVFPRHFLANDHKLAFPVAIEYS